LSDTGLIQPIAAIARRIGMYIHIRYCKYPTITLAITADLVQYKRWVTTHFTATDNLFWHLFNRVWETV